MGISFTGWQTGCGQVRHQDTTIKRIQLLIEHLHERGLCTVETAIRLLMAADRLCNMGMWLTVHMTYARQAHLDGRPLQQDDFKTRPEGHTSEALNMVPAYVGYLLANALTGKTRAWLMEQGHCVAAIDAINVLTRNLGAVQQERYPLTDAGLSRLCQDFYGYETDTQGRPAAPLGSHVSPHTAGGISAGACPGSAGLQYVHMPLPGQELVSFLSDEAFEQQRGSDWAAHWWRGEDTGLVLPVMISNGRRFDQSTTMAQSGGVDWFRNHLLHNGFDPMTIDGRDPAAFAWAIITLAERLQEQHRLVALQEKTYPVSLPCAVAQTIRDCGSPWPGSNAAHNLTLAADPADNEGARESFNQACRALYVPVAELEQAIAALMNHNASHRVMEKDHCLRRLRVSQPELPGDPGFVAQGSTLSSMTAIDQWFSHFVQLNPCHRVRVGNPDDMRSNRMDSTLNLLRHRVTAPEPGTAEAVCGAVITALNAEAVVSAALANKQGINLLVSDEAFAVKMLGAMRQEILFARQALDAGQEAAWLSVPVLLSSHTWENGKNGQSHQDPALAEAWLGEMSDVAPVYFPFDANVAIALMEKLYTERARIAVVVAARNDAMVRCNPDTARQVVREGALLLSHDEDADIQLLAVGLYQLQSVELAAQVLREAGVAVSIVVLLEPGRFREARDARERSHVHDDAQLAAIIPACKRRIIVSHTRTEIMTGVLRRLDTGPARTRFLGYRNCGGTLDAFGMLVANQQTWAHIVHAANQLLDIDSGHSLGEAAQQALTGSGNIDVLRCPLFQHGSKSHPRLH